MVRIRRAAICSVLPVLVLLLTLSPVLADGPWATAQRLDNDSSNSSMPAIAIAGSDVAALWIQSTGFDTYSIQSNRSTDGGETWEGVTRISGDSLHYCTDARMAMSGPNVVTVWYQYDGGTRSIQSSCSSDRGATWSSPVRIDDAAIGEPDVAIDGSNVVATWKESDGSGNVRIVANWSSDGGATWQGSQDIDFDYGDVESHLAEYPKAVIQGQNAVVAWKTIVKESGVYYHRVYANASHDGGGTWGRAQLLSSDTESYSPELAMSGSTVIAIWNDNDGGTSIYYNRSSDSGTTWNGAARLDNGAAGGKYVPSIDMSGSQAAAVWTQWDGRASVVWSNCSDDGGATWAGAQVIVPTCTTDMHEPNVAMSDSSVVAVWRHNDGTADRVYSSFSTDGGETWSDMQRIQSDAAISANWPRVASSGTRAVAVWHQHDDATDVYSNYFEEPESIDLELKAGWNMVSVPIQARDMSSGTIFGSAEAVYWWNPVTKSYTIPTSIDPKKGYWVAVSSDQTVTVTGEPVENWTGSLSAGWNMIGSVSGDPIAVGNLDDVPADTVQDGAIYTWNPTGKCYSIASQIEEGKGYWAACTAACDLVVGPPPF